MWVLCADFNHSFSLLLSVVNCTRRSYIICHLASNRLPHYLYKILMFNCTTVQRIYSIQKCTKMLINKGPAKPPVFFSLGNICDPLTEKFQNFALIRFVGCQVHVCAKCGKICWRRSDQNDAWYTEPKNMGSAPLIRPTEAITIALKILQGHSFLIYQVCSNRSSFWEDIWKISFTIVSR